jgi:hypothetical protein
MVHSRTVRKAFETALLIVCLGVAACGGGLGRSGSEAGSGPPSAEFPTAKLARFGHEASPGEREAASSILEKNLEARQRGDFAVQCASLATAGLREVVPDPKKGGARRTECPSALRKLAEPLIDSDLVRADTLAGSVAALRLKGRKAYALYHGKDGTDYTVPMSKEGGRWRVGSIYTTKLGPTHISTR